MWDCLKESSLMRLKLEQAFMWMKLMSMSAAQLGKHWTTTTGNLNSEMSTREWHLTPSQLAPQEKGNVSLQMTWMHGWWNRDLMQCGTWDENRTAHDRSTTTRVAHPNLNLAANILFTWREERQQFPKTTWRQPRAPHHLWKWSGSSVALPCRCLVWRNNFWMSREHTQIAKCSEKMCASRDRRNLVWNRHNAFESRDAGMGRVKHDTVRDDFVTNDFSQGRTLRARHTTQRLWYSVHCDDYVGLEAEVGLEWCRQQVSKRFIKKLHGYLGPAALHEHEMRVLTRVLTWRSSEAGRAVHIWGSWRFKHHQNSTRRLWEREKKRHEKTS